jgi:hypothetical protein
MSEVCDLEIIAQADAPDQENLLFAARKRKQHARSVARDSTEVDATLALIASYVTASAGVQRTA